jgi:hypothetical protein
MNNQDKEAFEKWYSEYFKIEGITIINIPHHFTESWKAACEYKKEAFDAYVRRDEIIKSLQAGNKKLKDALKNCLIMSPLDPFERSDMIREALKEVGEA